jgi:hypothetical protein
MNDLNQLEKQLESWIPRRPSAKIRRQLFPAATAKAEHHAPMAALWLSVGAAACVLLASAWLALPRQTGSTALVVSGGSNLIASLTLPATLQGTSCQNLWSAVTFEWTKASSYPPITGPSGLGRTNL